MCPDAVEGLIPYFEEKLDDPTSSVRLSTVDMLGKLLSEPGAFLPHSGRVYLTRQFAKNRFIDVKVRDLPHLYSCTLFCGSD